MAELSRVNSEVSGGAGGSGNATVSGFNTKSSEKVRMCGQTQSSGGSSYHHQHYQHHQPLSQFNKMTSESSSSTNQQPTAQRKTGNLKQPPYTSMHPHQHHHHPLFHQAQRLNGGDQSITSITSPSNSCVCFGIFNEDDFEKIEDWLDEHPGFVQNYFIRKASRTLIDSWMLTHASSLTTSGKFLRGNSSYFLSTQFN